MAVEDEELFLNTLEGEIVFFRSLMRARPVGIHKHFHAMVIRSAIQRDTGRWVPMEEIWQKLRSCYDMDLLESIETDGFDFSGSSPGAIAGALRSPSPSENLATHPYFKTEFALPDDPVIEDIISKRRMRASVSSVSAAPSPVREKPPASVRSSKRTKSKNKMAGLVGGDSDSSALTQESGDESVAPTPAATADDAGTEYAEDGDREQSPAEPATSSKQPRKGQKSARRNSNAMATRTKTSTAIKKKKKGRG
ncbi:hypothetical protein BDY19DRAFT_1042284 [Irpex rosettiformis]|uniref:Uncharacterized protein n=1 Tax=Irpex rosettiformis TaxID=378272 RepID=A0ACB8U0U5_9APHY|nr:hypothetical protein BDY19DRAFT_1042284 [Irpex rosettiformis]